MKDQTPTQRLVARARMWQPTNDCNLDLLYDMADHMTQLAAERDAADARVKALEAELIVSNANGARLGEKVRLMVAATEPQVWAENSRNRNRILEIAMSDGEKVNG